MKKLLEAVTKFSGEEEGQKSGDQWRGTDKGTPGKKLVGASESMLKDLNKGPTPKTKEQELAEQWAKFMEDELGTHPKRPGRKSDRPARGHKELPGYTTIKSEGRVKDLSIDLKELTDAAFLKKYKKTKQQMRSALNEGWGTGSDRVSLPDTPNTYYSGTGQLQKEYEELYDKLVPAQGAAETIEGEVLRAASKIVYRHYNDGDEFNQASFDQLKPYIGNVTSYDDLAHKATMFALAAEGEYNPNTGWDSLDVMEYGPEEDDDDGYDDYAEYPDDDDEDDEDIREGAADVYSITSERNGKERSKSGTLAELIEYYSHTLEIGKSYEHERGNKKINVNPKNIESLVQNLNNAKSNAAANGQSSERFYVDYGYLEEGMEEFAKAQAKKRADARKEKSQTKEGWESGPEERSSRERDPDAEYDAMRQQKADAEAQAAQAKRPQTKVYTLTGRGPNMEPNYKFPGEYASQAEADAARTKLMANPKTPNPRMIGISVRTKYLDQTNESYYKYSVKNPDGRGGVYHKAEPGYTDQTIAKDIAKAKRDNPQATIVATKDGKPFDWESCLNENSVTPLRDKEDLIAKTNALRDLEKYPELRADVDQRKQVLAKQANNIKENKVVPVITAFRKGMQKIAASSASAAEKQTAFDKLSAEFNKNAQAYSDSVKNKRKVTEYGANNTPDPKQIAATQTMKSASGSSAPTAAITKAVDTASQGKALGQQDAKALEPMMNILGQAAQDPKLANQFKTLAQQAKISATQQAK